MSLLASATEIVSALGLQQHLVAISHECDYPTDVLDRPRVSRPRFDPATMTSGAIDQAVRAAMAEHGSVYALDETALAALEPDVIFTQAVCEVCAVPTPGVERLVERLGLRARVVSLDAHDLAGIYESIAQVGEALDAPDRAAALLRDLHERVADVRRRVNGARTPGVLAIEWLDPPFTPGHWVPEMIALAGGVSLAGEAGRHSREVSWTGLKDVDPDILVIMPCGYDLAASRADADTHAEQLHALAPRAIREGHAFVVNGSAFFNRSGPRVVDGIEILAKIIHPDRAAHPVTSGFAPWPESM